jgi:hypothetical protein
LLALLSDRSENLYMNFKGILNKPDTFSEISRDVGQIFFGAMVIGQIVSNDPINWAMFGLGSFLSLLSWIFSVIMKKQ